MNRSFKVHMLANQPEYLVRTVEVPDMDWSDELGVLSAIVTYGQNEVQPQTRIVSVSTGDVIELDTKLVLIGRFCVFTEITREQFNDYKLIPRRDRELYSLLNQE